MESKEQVVELIEDYLTKFPEEKDRSEALIQFVNAHDGESLTDRKNFTGHITTSAFIVDPAGQSLLLLKHKSLNRWLQPGGHVDISDNSLAASALREACEETGLTEENLELVSASIFDIDSHNIPENTKKQEPAHTHHDVRFLFQCTNASDINISLEESTDSKWVSFADLAANEDFDWFLEKMKKFREYL